MPARVVALPRKRRRAFAVLRDVPAWLRALAATFSPPHSLSAHESSALAGETKPDAAPEPRGEFQVGLPRFAVEPVTTRCRECRRCEAVCPASALAWRDVQSSLPALAFKRVDAEGDGTSLFLDASRCIGCAECVRVCPESWLAMAPNRQRVIAGSSRPESDLLADPMGRVKGSMTGGV